MQEGKCPKCCSDDNVVTNTTNFAARYYCNACNHPFDPPYCECPDCGRIKSVLRNPFDDPFAYYCYRCEFAFDRLGPSFELTGPQSERDDVSKAADRVSLTVEKDDSSSRGVHAYIATLRNEDSETIRTRGSRPVAIQYRIDENEWWTLYGNPDRFTPTETVQVEPNSTLKWQLGFQPRGITVSDTQLKQEPLPSGTYRFVYWGFADDLGAVGCLLNIEFETGW